MTTQISGTTGLSRNALPFLVGQVIFTAGGVAPAGFLKCDGSAVSRITYAALFAVCGTTYGVGNGSTTFNLPDLRGEFLRGLDDGRGVDAGRAVGSWQNHLFASHTHSIGPYSCTTNTSNTATEPRWSALSSAQAQATATANAAGGTETRPRNVALLACIFTGI